MNGDLKRPAGRLECGRWFDFIDQIGQTSAVNNDAFAPAHLCPRLIVRDLSEDIGRFQGWIAIGDHRSDDQPSSLVYVLKQRLLIGGVHVSKGRHIDRFVSVQAAGADVRIGQIKFETAPCHRLESSPQPGIRVIQINFNVGIAGQTEIDVEFAQVAGQAKQIDMGEVER